METVTLLHSRWPKDEFIYSPATGDNIDDVDDLTPEARAALYRTPGRAITASPNRKRISGLWGTMVMVIGDPIRAAQFDWPIMGPLFEGETRHTVTISNREVHLVVKGSIASTRLYTTVERYRTDDGRVNQWDFGYVRLMSRDMPYDLRNERGNSVVRTLRDGHDGACIRILGGSSAQQRAILIHEAPHVGWVVGCIGPRPHGNRQGFVNRPGNPADLATREIMAELARRGGTGKLFVLRS